MPKLSIIIPTFNSSRTLPKCLQSIAEQSFTDYEVVIQDGASTDETLDLIRTFEEANSHLCLKLVSERDSGAYDAMNRGIKRASGDWLYFLGSDDELYDEGALGTMMKAAESFDGDVLYGDVKIVGNSPSMRENQVYDGAFTLEKLLNRNICHQSIFYRRRLVADLGGFNTRYVLYADWDLNLQCWTKTQFRYVNAIVAKYSVGGFSSTGPADEVFNREVAANAIRYFGLSMFSPILNRWQFRGFPEVTRMQREAGFWHRFLGRVLRTAAKRWRLARGAAEC